MWITSHTKIKLYINDITIQSTFNEYQITHIRHKEVHINVQRRLHSDMKLIARLRQRENIKMDFEKRVRDELYTKTEDHISVKKQCMIADPMDLILIISLSIHKKLQDDLNTCQNDYEHKIIIQKLIILLLCDTTK